MIEPRHRLMLARQRLGKAPEEVACAVGMNSSSYYDLELVDQELETNISFRRLQQVCEVLGICLSSLFLEEPRDCSEMILPEDLAEKISQHIRKSSATVAEFEASVGFNIGGFLSNPSLILDWDIECLFYVCEPLNINWHLVLLGIQKGMD